MPMLLPGTNATRARAALLCAGAGLAVALLGAAVAGSTGAAGPASGMTDGHLVYLASWSLPVAAGEPIDLAIDRAGRLYVADARFNAVLVYDAALVALDAWDDPPTGPLPGYVYVPIAVEADAQRDVIYILWVRYREEGAALTEPALFLDTRAAGTGKAQPLRALTFVDGARDMALDGTGGDLLLRAGETVTRLSMPGGVPLGGFAVGAGAGRLAVAADGRTAVVRPSAGRVDLYGRDGLPAGRIAVPQGTPLDVSATGDGRLHVLVRAPSRADPGAPVVVTFDAGGVVVGTRAAAEIGAPVPPAGDWPWSLAMTDTGGALVTGSGRFQVGRFDSTGAVGRPLRGSPVRAAFAPHSEDAALLSAPVALASDAGGDLLALDVRMAQVVRFGADGTPGAITGAPEHAVDLAVGGAGEVFVSSEDGWVRRLAAGDAVAAVWTSACDCDLGGRLAAAGGTLFATRPREQAVAALATATGDRRGVLQLVDAVGLWPGDVATDRAGRLLTADLVTARIEVWAGDDTPADIWQTGLLSGPRRLAVGELADGTEVAGAAMADGSVEMHALADGNLVARWTPRLPDGRIVEVSDIALGADGQVFLADARGRAVHVFGPGGGIPPTDEPTPAASPTPSDLSCMVRGDKVAAPARVVLGSAASVTLTLAADCPARARRVGADIVLVIDRSGSMQGAKLAAAQGAARTFAELLDVRYHRLALASFSSDASMDVPLTESVPSVIDGIEALVPGGGTNLAAAIERAADHLVRFGRPDALPVVVLLSDGRNNEQTPDPLPAAATARTWGVQFYTIGLGDDVNAAMLRDLAGRPDAYFGAPTPTELFPIYGEILRVVTSSLAGNLVIDDLIGDGVRYEPGSARPLALESSGRLRWGRSILPSSGLTLTYRVQPLAPGCSATNRQAVADFTDGDGARRQFAFPIPTVCAITPTPGPTPTATPTRTRTPHPTRTPVPVHLALPALYRNTCLPGAAHADVVLLIDTSSSMQEGKLVAARDAASAFVGYLDLSRDQAAVIAFDAAARLAVGLSRDRAAIERAIAGLATASGTRIDLGLWAALGELRGARRDGRNRGVIILLSDGGQGGARGDVLDIAGEARALGAQIFTIGLGADADAALLVEVAGAGARYYAAPGAGDLAAIYRAIAVTIPCR
jgi:Mg-chelatase subunit ChlD